jgi:hypothetical protein
VATERGSQMQDNRDRPSSDELIRQARERYSRRNTPDENQDEGTDGPKQETVGSDLHRQEPDPSDIPRANVLREPIAQREGQRTRLSTDDWPKPPARSRRTRPGTIRWIIASAVIGVATFGAALAAQLAGQSGPSAFDEVADPLDSVGVAASTDLAVGDCVMLPEGVAFDESFQFETLDSVACDQPHDMEVFATFSHQGGLYPGKAELFDFAGHYCPGAFEDYTGVPYEHEAHLVITSTVPDVTGWSQSDHSVECLLQSFDGAQLVGTQEGRGLLGYPGLQVTHCYDVIDGGSYAAFTDVSCEGPHDVELFHVAELEHGESAPFPGEEWLDTFAEYRCAARFEPYVGEPWSPDMEIDYVWVVPSVETWEAGDRRIQCLLVPVDLTAGSLNTV